MGTLVILIGGILGEMSSWVSNNLELKWFFSLNGIVFAADWIVIDLHVKLRLKNAEKIVSMFK